MACVFDFPDCIFRVLEGITLSFFVSYKSQVLVWRVVCAL